MVGVETVAEIGVGGVFLYARDPAALAEWYRRNLGIEANYLEGERAWCHEFGSGDHQVIWAILPRAQEASGVGQLFMVNYRVADLAAALARCRACGTPVEKSQDYPYGRFAWIRDPEGNQIELYEALDS